MDLQPISAEDYALREFWIRWWCTPWSWAHHIWHDQFASLCGLPAEGCAQLMRGHCAEFLLSAGINPSQPPEPDPKLMQWLMLSAEQQNRALDLAGRICFGGDLAGATKNPDMDGDVHEAWCRRLAKALRPGQWVEPKISDARQLLGAWTDAACWSRLRLCWPPCELPETLATICSHKLQTLWVAVFWRVTTP